ncbi:aldehyde dehydrogenase family protein [Sphingobium sp. Sx8-8]|uniref:aldehyde dehydrogenase family protein n=1 Tax=Sphingobium sp. Sx8-8 TaxID=2933617 RepID=UPI001F59CC11|nr:aldehyde dehydrogenase family protein [Sphingobium sp. Sx8-8]
MIGGEWRVLKDIRPGENPARLSDNVGQFGWADEADARAAVASAREALAHWRGSNPQVRSDLLRKIGDTILASADTLGTLLAREEGKTFPEARGEAIRAAQVFHYYAGEPLRHPGAFMPSLREGFNVIVDYEPVGVLALITPWNFPLATPAWKIAGAMAYGNTVVLKPSEFTPAVSVALAAIIHEAGTPAGVFNLIPGDGSLLGPLLIDETDGVSFTGSSGNGQRVLERATKGMKKVQLELGGKNPLLVMADADLNLAVDVALQGAFHQTGQRCTASSRLIVQESIHEEFVARLSAQVDALRVGDPLDPTTQMGPVANAAQLQKNHTYVAEAEQAGALRVAGTDGGALPRGGHFMRPILFANTTNAMTINQEEVFGPIAAVVKVGDLDEGIATANDTQFALSSAICTTSLSVAEAFRRASKAGMVMVNAPTAGVEYHVPFGGRAPSGYGGREQGTASAEFFTEIKTSYINHGCR